MYLKLGAYNLGAYSLAQPIWDLAAHSLRWLVGWHADSNSDVFGVRAYSHGAYSRASDLASRNALTALVVGLRSSGH